MNISRMFWTLFCLACLLFSQLLCANDSSVEYKIKSGYLYNFTKFVTWPEDNANTFNLCILGVDPFGQLIDPIEQRSAFGRPIKLFRFHTIDNINDTNNVSLHCHILFVSSSIQDSPFMLKGMLVDRNIDNTLTIGDSETFAAQGGMIGFINRQGRIKLQINLKTIKEGGLKVSAKLLEVSELVEGGSND